MNFDGLNLGDELKALLNGTVGSGRLPHAIILEGGSEADRLALARLLARAHLCQEADKPCGSCSHCLKAEKGIHPDITEAVAQEGKTEALKVDAIRQIRQSAFVYPNDGERRVFILHNMQYANEQAQNALLKILEEPPEYVRFVLTVPVASSLLTTIISRAAVYSLGQQLSDSLNQKNGSACQKAAAVAAALVSPNEFDLMRQTGDFEKDAELLILTLAQLRLIFRDALARKQSSAATLLSGADESAYLLAKSCTTAQLVKLMEAVAQLEQAAAQNANKSLLITRFCSLMRSALNK